MFIKTRQGRPCRNEKAMDKETLDTIQQNPDLNEDDIEHMMSLAFGKENSAIAPHSSASTHVPCFDQVDQEPQENTAKQMEE
ncbi:hypothetical protein DEO72_LG5g1666 [Vigna unguiculata]|uniref:Uncharacterized protein n=1 Tax=Vigna unguiculata TaxID=3917 RepID=A0A4D6LZ10_VIGUN|nr:hypothetical protein DEO72_LG5g1666 [Vigna unguiculata]